MSLDESFLRRWSRRKQAAAAPARPAAPVPSAAELPPVEALHFESDFGAFLRAKVDEGVRRAALKTLFSDPRFNVMDGLDIYIDDYSKADPIPPGLLARLEHSRDTLCGPKREEPVSQEPGTLAPQASSIAPPETPHEADRDAETEG